jgi:hypothetical protein
MYWLDAFLTLFLERLFIKTGKSTQTFFSKLTIDVYNFIDADMKETTMCWQNNRNVD